MIAQKRKIKPGTQYNAHIGKAQNLRQVVVKNGGVEDTINLCLRVVKTTLPETKKLAQLLRGQDRLETCRNIWNFIIDYIQYEYDFRDGDVEAIERVRTPARTWADRSKGADCEDYSIFCSSILTNLGIPHSFRITKYGGKPSWQHIYVIVPFQADPSRKGYITLDAVVDDQFNKEVPYSAKKDFPVIAKSATSLAGVPQQLFTQPHTTLLPHTPRYMKSVDAIIFDPVESEPSLAGVVSLGSIENFNEAGYLTLYPDVRKVVQKGHPKFKTGLDHYKIAGKYEGRVPDYDDAAYRRLNPDVMPLVASGKYTTAAQHFLKAGRAEGRKYRATDQPDVPFYKNPLILGGGAAVLLTGFLLLKK